MQAREDSSGFVKALNIGDLEQTGARVVKLGKKQIAVFKTGKGLRACNNRCPHEGYPLSQGTMDDGCVLTCNWHNWKFDLEDGSNIYDGDHVRVYPVEQRGEEIWVDVTDPPAEEVQADALKNLKASFPRHEYDRMARELYRMVKAGGDPMEAVRKALEWTTPQLQYGMTHAHAAAPDWLALREEVAEDEAEGLIPLVEIIGHLAWDTMREPEFPYAEGSTPYDEDKLVTAIEDEDQELALALARGAINAGLGWDDVERGFARAALAHYQDFGHSAIYVYKIGQLVSYLGPEALPTLLPVLIRGLIFARREDLIPEFKDYAPALAAWDGTGDAQVAAGDFVKLGVGAAVKKAVSASGDVPALYDALLGAAASQMLHYDMGYMNRYTGSVSQNVAWLDFSHAITFGNAARALAEKYPELWPAACLQIACFTGRNAAFVDLDQDVSEWTVSDPAAFLRTEAKQLFDHGTFEYIVSAHLLKFLMAVREEVSKSPSAPWVGDLLATLNRFLHSPFKRKHVQRTMRQAIGFVAAED